MISIKKPNAPDRLTSQGATKAKQHLIEYSADPISFDQGNVKFSFSNKIYSHSTVKDALVIAQHGKCCFCERFIGHDGDIEHFRPKGSYQQKPGDSLIYPGYYWLAYEWSNLYLSCSAGNQRHKGSLFPLQQPANRAHDFQNDTTVEEPLFIDPGQDDPSKYISFRGEFAHSIDDNQKGISTIDHLGLNRDVLNNARRRHLQVMKALYELATAYQNNQALQQEIRQAKKVLEEAILDSAEFAAATRQAMETRFVYVLDS